MAESAYIRYVAVQPCSVCDAGGGEGAPSEVHEIEQGNWWLSVALCSDCHRGYNGLHGTKAYWRVRKMSELDALSVTIRRIFDASKRYERRTF